VLFFFFWGGEVFKPFCNNDVMCLRLFCIQKKLMEGVDADQVSFIVIVILCCFINLIAKKSAASTVCSQKEDY